MSQIDEVRRNGDSVTIFAEGHFITFVMGEGGRLKYTAFSGGYFAAFRFRPACTAEHEEVAMGELEKPFEEKLSLKKKKGRGKGKKKKEIINPYDRNCNPYPINPTDFPVGANGEYLGLPIVVIYNRVAALYREKKGAGELPDDYREIINEALKNLGFNAKNLSGVHSALSKEMWKRRKERAAAIARKRIEDARQAEFAHLLPLEN